MGQIRWTRSTIVTLVGIIAAIAMFGVLAYRRRWMSDDGLIALRTVRQILDGHGPVFNTFERAEVNTSTVWTYLLVLVVGVTGRDPALVAVVTGWVLAVAGVAIAIDGTRRWHRDRGSHAMIVPAGVLVMLGVFPFWDYATSGLETGLCQFWIATCWWLLVATRRELRMRRQLAIAVAIGVGPLVRPDFALVSIVFLAAMIALLRPSRRRALGVVCAAFALPFAYEMFRAGYYGVLVPLPAITKNATAAEWARGLDYVRDFAEPYRLWLPLAVLAGLFVYAARRTTLVTRDRILIAAPIASALLTLVFVLRVGGDFMHGRMCLPPTFMLLLPAIVVPLRRFAIPAIAVVAGWALVTAIMLADGKNHATGVTVNDERVGYIRFAHNAHPIRSAVFVAAERGAAAEVDAAFRDGRRLLLSEGGLSMAINPQLDAPLVFAVGRLGTGGVIGPLDAIVADTLGLANPIGARITVTNPGMTGHEKMLPWAWLRADFSDPALDASPVEGSPPIAIAAARHAMTCGALKELLDSVRAPLTAGRFWSNLIGALARTRLVIPADPLDAELEFCGTYALPVHVSAATSFEGDGWSTINAIDGQRVSTDASRGYSSEVGAPQWIALDFVTARPVSKVTLYPRSDDAVGAGAGFPVDFAIQIWDGTRWLDRVTRTDYARPAAVPQVFALPTPEITRKVRIYATKLADVNPGEPRLQIAEIEVD